MEKKDLGLGPGMEGIPGARRATGVPSISAAASPLRSLHALADPEVPEKASRRKFTAEYKLRILQEAETCREAGQIGALLRREGLYSSHLTTWRQQADQGRLQALGPRKRGPKVQPPNPLAKRVATLEKETQHLRHQLKQAETIIEVQKKISEILQGASDLKDGSKS